jgi:tetratricopeptide (TPR) repeat protein
MTDLAGVRVIVFVRDSVDEVCQMIAEVLDVLEIEDVGDRVYNLGKFGYQSKHLLIKLGADRQSLVENSDFQNLVCEIQVRTLLQHAWAEMEHDIQYKSDQEIPLDLKKRFSALAGLLELADREFQSIQRDSESLRIAVKSELINDLTEQSLSEKSRISEGQTVEGSQAVAARDLLSQGRYAEAIDIYSKKIESEPTAHTLYIGRAKARFVNGDVRGAISDLDHVDTLRGDASLTLRLRSIIQQGDDPKEVLHALKYDSKHNDGVKAAENALSMGEGVKAFIEFTALEAEGYSAIYAQLGKAMACIVERDVVGASSYLEHIELRPATAMAVNLCVLRAIIARISGSDFEVFERRALEIFDGLSNYSFEVSPVRPLVLGMERRRAPELEEIQRFISKIVRSTQSAG